MKRKALYLVASVFLIWPIIIDQEAMGCWFVSNACTQGEGVALLLKLISLGIGGIFSSFLFPLRMRGWKLWVVRCLLAIAVAALFYGGTFIADFSREVDF